MLKIQDGGCIVCAKINAVGLVLMHCQDHDLDPGSVFVVGVQESVYNIINPK